jgi:protocatechuate 3,4-dioxygenase beta subunit
VDTHIDNDDEQIGRILSRREALALFGAAAGAMLLAACAPGQAATLVPSSAPAQAAPSTVTPTQASSATQAPSPTASLQAQAAATAAPTAAAAGTVALPTCIVRPALTEGPYFVDEKLNRSDIRSDPSDNNVKAGAPLNLTLRVSKVSGSGCTALSGATIDVWHCDALGVYWDASDPSFNTKGKKFLRGYQMTDANGTATFTTIYPGWYQGRAVHIHLKIRTKTSSDATYDFTSQFFFDETITDQVHAQAPYAAKGQGRLRNGGDGVYQGGGAQLLLAPARAAQGYASTFDIGVQIA